MTKQNWPLQAECDAFYGNPRGDGGGHVNSRWYSDNMMTVPVPFLMYFDKTPVRRIAIHHKCADSLIRVFARVQELWSADPASLHDADLHYDGSFNYRPKRGQRSLSMHAYGCAIDIDAANNPFGKRKMRFTKTSPWVVAFEGEGWIWGGRWNSPDGMHFQAARVK